MSVVRERLEIDFRMGVVELCAERGGAVGIFGVQVD